MRTVVLLVLLSIVGCSHDVRVRFPALPEQPTSSVVLRLSDAAQGVSVAVNGILVVEDEHTEKVVIDNVPVGHAEIVLVANGGDKAMRVWVGADSATTIPMGVPDGGGAGGFLKTIFASVVTMAIYALLN